MWLYFRLTMQFQNRLVGGIPKSPKMIEAWLNQALKEQHAVKELAAQTMQAMQVESVTEEAMEEIAEAAWTGFKSDACGLYWEGRCLKAAFKEAASVNRERTQIAAFKARVAERVFVLEERLYLERMEPDGSEQRPLHVMTPKGPKTALKRIDYVTRPRITAHLKVFNQTLVAANKKRFDPRMYLEILLEYMEQNGGGTDRSQGEGLFLVEELTSIARHELPEALRGSTVRQWMSEKTRQWLDEQEAG